MAEMIKASVSGIRGIVGEGLTPELVLAQVSAFVRWNGVGTYALGRDTRHTGIMLSQLAAACLQARGCHVVDLGICPTPTLLSHVRRQRLAGGILITASHNPIEWNALKLVKKGGVFPDAADFSAFHETLGDSTSWCRQDRIGRYSVAGDEPLTGHIEECLLTFDANRIRQRRFSVAIDPGNGAGAVLSRRFLSRLKCRVAAIHEEITGGFARNPEPRPDVLQGLGRLVQEQECVVGFAQDPDADRLCLVDETGRALSEEYTLALAVQAWFRRFQGGDVVVNMSTSRVVEDVARRSLARTWIAPVGEANVLAEMRTRKAVIGGEGNGGVIVPSINPCRDSFVGMLLILDLLAHSRRSLSQLVEALPHYEMRKLKLDGAAPADYRERIRRAFRSENRPDRESESDGLRLDFNDGWVHVRESNTEPIVRLIAEGRDPSRLDRWITLVREALGG